MASATGAILVEDACGTCSKYCGTGCNLNSFLCAWPNHNSCSGVMYCRDKPNQAWGGYCNYSVTFDGPCAIASPSCCIQDCGPAQAQGYTACCQPAYRTAIACMTVAAMQYLCNYCNPYPGGCGIVYGTGTPNLISC